MFKHILAGMPPLNIRKLMKGKALRKHSLHEKTAFSVLKQINILFHECFSLLRWVRDVPWRRHLTNEDSTEVLLTNA